MAVGTISPGHNKKPEQLNSQQSWPERILSVPQRLSSIASARPVHTIGLVSLLVSSAYVALLENSLLDVSKQGDQQETPRHFYTGPDTAWQWHSRSIDVVAEGALDHRALVTLEFGHLSNDIPTVSLPDHLSVDRLPSSLDSSARPLAFSVAQSDVSEFLDLIHKSPVGDQSEEAFEGYQWVVKTQDGSSRGITQFARDKWTELVYLFNHAAPLDIAIMAAAYIAMHLTFASLFLSMYRMGSRFWLFAGVLISSTFAFLFALFTATRLGVHINLALLSEGLPFLVVVIGFENPVKFTQAVLRHATTGQGMGQSIIQTAIDKSIKSEGPKIIKHYALEIAVLLAGSLLSVDPALRQFCFLASWILFFDCINLFSFYTAILCTKLEIIRIQTSGKEHRPQARKDRCMTVFGQQLSRTHIRKFKLGMVAAFILVNVLNMTMIPFRMTTGSPVLSSRPDSRQTFPGLHTHLKAILDEAAFNERPTLVSVLPPVRFELVLPENEGFQTYGVDSLLKSLEDPVLVKCVLVALVISVALNGRLFAAARCGVKDKNTKNDTKGENALSKKKSPQKPPRSESDGHIHRATKSVKEPTVSAVVRTEAECQTILKSGNSQTLTDEEVINLSLAGKLPLHALEKTLKDFTRAVKIRRSIVSRTQATIDLTQSLEGSDLPYESYDWSRVFGVCCENVIGYMPVPVGLAGPLTIDNKSYFLPMATTEGVLVAGVMRGSKAINAGGGAKTVLTADGMTRGPCVSFESLDRAADAKKWLDSIPGQDSMKAAFNSTTRYGRLESMKTAMAGTTLYIRFKASTGDAMGMNMISKGVEHALDTMREKGFEDMDIISLSGNYCSDKKPAAINWIDGRGKSVVAQATIAPEIVKNVLKTDVESMVALNTDKNLIGSAMAGSIGGFNAHAANIVAAMYIATGQDPAQVVESANCITIMKK